MQLPKYNAGSALLDLSQVNQGIDSIQRANQLAIQNQRADEKLNMQREQFGMQKTQFEADQKQRQAALLANRASVIDGLPEGQRQAAYLRLLQGTPGLQEELAKAGVDPNDHINGPKFIMAEAGKYDPLGKRMKEAQINNLNARTNYYKTRAMPQTTTAPAAKPDPTQGAGLTADGKLVFSGQPQQTAGSTDWSGPTVNAIDMLPKTPNVPGVGFMPPLMKLGGPKEDYGATYEPGGPTGVQVAQATIPNMTDGASIPGAPSLMEQARIRASTGDVAGVESDQVPGVVTAKGRSDALATREYQGQTAMNGVSPQQRENLIRFRNTQRMWANIYGRNAKTGFYFDANGAERPTSERTYKGDREQQALITRNMSVIDDATKVLKNQSFGAAGRAISGTLNYGENARAFSDMRQAAMNIAYILSGKTVGKAELQFFMDAYTPKPTDSVATIDHKVKRMKSFYDALSAAKNKGLPPDQAWSLASTEAMQKQDPAKMRLKNKYGLE